MGSIYRHNEGGAPLAVAECAHKLPWFTGLRDCCGSDILSGLTGRLTWFGFLVLRRLRIAVSGGNAGWIFWAVVMPWPVL